MVWLYCLQYGRYTYMVYVDTVTLSWATTVTLIVLLPKAKATGPEDEPELTDTDCTEIEDVPSKEAGVIVIESWSVDTFKL